MIGLSTRDVILSVFESCIPRGDARVGKRNHIRGELAEDFPRIPPFSSVSVSLPDGYSLRSEPPSSIVISFTSNLFSFGIVYCCETAIIVLPSLVFRLETVSLCPNSRPRLPHRDCKPYLFSAKKSEKLYSFFLFNSCFYG